jgi:hypothetical protein
VPFISNLLVSASRITTVVPSHPGKQGNNARYLVAKNVKWFTDGYVSKLEKEGKW